MKAVMFITATIAVYNTSVIAFVLRNQASSNIRNDSEISKNGENYGNGGSNQNKNGGSTNGGGNSSQGGNYNGSNTSGAQGGSSRVSSTEDQGLI